MGQIVAYDTNVFIYWLDTNSPYFDKSVAALRLLGSPGVSAVTSVLTIAELTAGLNRTAVSLLLTDLGNQLTVVPVDQTIAEQAGLLRRKLVSLRTPDAIHIATAMQSGATTFITNDQDLAKLSLGIEIQLLREL